jgi:hypothetical protein
MYEIRRKIRSALYRLAQRLPVLCSCGHFCSRRNVEVKFTTWGARVTFCPRCHEERFG